MRFVETQAKREGWMKWRSYLLRYFHVKFAFCLNGVGRGCDVVKRDNHFRNSHVTRGVGQQPWNTYIEQTNILSLNLRIDQWVSWFSTSIHWCFRGLICRWTRSNLENPPVVDPGDPAVMRWVPAAVACGNPILIFPLLPPKRWRKHLQKENYIETKKMMFSYCVCGPAVAIHPFITSWYRASTSPYFHRLESSHPLNWWCRFATIMVTWSWLPCTL